MTPIWALMAGMLAGALLGGLSGAAVVCLIYTYPKNMSKRKDDRNDQRKK